MSNPDGIDQLAKLVRESSSAIERELAGIKRISIRQHLEMNLRMLVARETDESYLALLLCGSQGFHGTPFTKILFG